MKTENNKHITLAVIVIIIAATLICFALLPFIQTAFAK